MHDSQIEFHWFPLWLAQVLRTFCIASFPFIYVVCSIQWKRARDYSTDREVRAQRARFVALGLFAFGAAYTETYRFFSVVTPRLFVNVAGTVAALVGLWAMRKHADTGGHDGRQAKQGNVR